MNQRRKAGVLMIAAVSIGIAAAIFIFPILRHTPVQKLSYRFSEEISGNPLMGYAPSAWKEEVEEDVQLLYVDITWRELEPEKGYFDWDTIEEENQFERWRQEGKHLVLRFICDLPDEESHMDIPDWLYEETEKSGSWYETSYGKGYAPDYTDRKMISYHRQAVEQMGQRWGGDTLIAFIELGSLGHWGEWHVKSGEGLPPIPDEEIRMEYIEPWVEAFPKADLLMRRPFAAAKQYGMGVYNDMAGEPDSTETWLEWIEEGGEYDQTGEENAMTAMAEFWKTAPSGGEFTSSLSMEEMLETELERTIDLLRASHTSFLGPKTADSSYPEGRKEVLKNLGYQLWISEGSLKEKKDGGSVLELVWENYGNAPFYRNWPVYVAIKGPEGDILERKQLKIHLSEILPGTQLKSSMELETEGLLSRKDMEYQMILYITDPMTGKAALRLANQETGESREMLLLARSTEKE